MAKFENKKTLKLYIYINTVLPWNRLHMVSYDQMNPCEHGSFRDRPPKK